MVLQHWRLTVLHSTAKRSQIPFEIHTAVNAAWNGGYREKETLRKRKEEQQMA